MRDLTPKMLSAMVDLFGNDLQEAKNFHHATIKGLVSRNMVSVNRLGYATLTDEGVEYLSDKRYAIVAAGIRIMARTVPFDHQRVADVIRQVHIKKALEEYNSTYSDMTGKSGIQTVDDMSNNVGRRCNIKFNNDDELRCWEVVTQFVFPDRPTAESLYILRYVGTKHTEYYGTHVSNYHMTDVNALTNLY